MKYRFLAPLAVWALATVAVGAPVHADPPAVDTGLTERRDTALDENDVLLFLQALGRMRSQKVTTTLSLDGTQPGLGKRVTARYERTLLTSTGGRFRSEVRVPGATPRRLLVIGDGKQVWTVDVAANRFSVQSAAAFSAGSDELFVLGITHMIVRDFPLKDGDLAQIEKAVTDPAVARDVVTSFQKGLASSGNAGAEMSVREEQVDGVARRVFSLAGETQRIEVDPQKRRVARVIFTGGKEEDGFSVAETVVSVVPAVPAPGSFTFVPPKGAKKVTQVQIAPF
jgi:hypothetical protein